MREKILELLNKKDFVSGKNLALQLNVSRTAIWKQIKILKNYGYSIEAVKKRGYRLISRPDIPRFEEMSGYLNTKIIGKKIIYFENIESTNIYAKKLAKEGISEGCVIVAGKQVKGRGRKNRIWSSPEGGLWFSIILYPSIPPQNAMIITMVASISIFEAITKDINSKSVAIKWPNDILVRGKKICGILTEFDAEMDRISYIVIGIGINVNNELKNGLNDIATSFKIETGMKYSIVELLADILNNFDRNYNYIKIRKLNYIKDLWLKYTNIVGKNIKVNYENSSLYGEVINVDNDGSLLIKTKEGEKRIFCGDVSYL
jgi:BirA family biotin operon repressor/biotin-[acetyl-CoA-carboxylase] ligase